ncbi:MAG TPA: TRAP transporter substrate-binding protein [Flavobacteriaceae bacterium]|nr:TRAP transporter substrate-binding protein [Flavobacteriaceae bacterium]
MKKTVFINRFLAVLFGMMLLTACSESSNTRVIKLAHGLDVNHSVHKAMLKMGEDLKTLSNGKMTLKIYPNQQLGSERENLELLQIGSLDMTKVSVGVMENFAPKMKVFGLPFLFRDKQHSFSVLDGPIGQELLNEGEKFWLKGLCNYDAGSRSFYTKAKSIETPNDLSGYKIRVMESATAMDMIRSLGGAPTPISWGELYTALQQGVVDGAENNPPSFFLSRHSEVCKYYSLDEHTTLPDVLVVGTQFWNSLNTQEQEWLQQAAHSSVSYQRELWATSEKEALEAVEKEGVKVVYPDKAPFQEAVKGIYEQYKGDATMWNLIEKIQQTQ